MHTGLAVVGKKVTVHYFQHFGLDSISSRSQEYKIVKQNKNQETKGTQKVVAKRVLRALSFASGGVVNMKLNRKEELK